MARAQSLSRRSPGNLRTNDPYGLPPLAQMIQRWPPTCASCSPSRTSCTNRTFSSARCCIRAAASFSRSPATCLARTVSCRSSGKGGQAVSGLESAATGVSRDMSRSNCSTSRSWDERARNGSRAKGRSSRGRVPFRTALPVIEHIDGQSIDRYRDDRALDVDARLRCIVPMRRRTSREDDWSIERAQHLLAATSASPAPDK